MPQSSELDLAHRLGARAAGAQQESEIGAGRHVARAQAHEFGDEIWPGREPAHAAMLAVLAADGDGPRIGFAHARIVVGAGGAPVDEEVVDADQYHVDAVDRDDLLDVRERRRALELHDDHGGVVERRTGFGCRERAVVQVRQAADVRALAQRREFCRPHHGLCGFRRVHMGRDHAERAAFQHARDVIGRIGGDPHERRDAGFERRDADLAAGLEREARMLKIDIEAVETRGRRDACDLAPAHQPHRHRRDHLVARELLLDVVAQDIADRHGFPPSRCADSDCRFSPLLTLVSPLARSGPARYAPTNPGASPARAGMETIHELRDRVQVDPRRGLGRGMAGACRSRRLLSPGRQVRHDRSHL